MYFYYKIGVRGGKESEAVGRAVGGKGKRVARPQAEVRFQLFVNEGGGGYRAYLT